MSPLEQESSADESLRTSEKPGSIIALGGLLESLRSRLVTFNELLITFQVPFIFIAISSPIIALRARTAVVRVPLAITLLGSATPVTVMTPATFIIPATTVSVPRALSSCIHSSKRIVGGALCKPDNQALEIRQDIQVLSQIQLQKAAIPDLEIVEGPMMKRQSPTY
ncbi:hypothetical protein F5H01DRAFT_370645 [Linnemannia elongata]|nr:hypothetical protein F5H01DRAFT_370645 [Linnemannia elongata]